MTSFNSFSDWRTIVLDLAGESTTDTAGDFYATAGRALDEAYQDICDRHPWLWLRKNPPGVLATVAPITTGTVAVTNASTAITFSSAPTPSVKAYKIAFTGFQEWYRIATHAAGATAATLDTAFNGTTNTAVGYTLYQDEFDLATDLRHLVGMFVTETGKRIEQKTTEYLRSNYWTSVRSVWPPRYFARLTEQRIRFEGYPDRARRIEYEYTFIPSDPSGASVTIDMPADYRRVVPYGALFRLYLDKNDDRAGPAGAVYGAMLDQIITDDLRKRQTLGYPNHPAPGLYG